MVLIWYGHMEVPGARTLKEKRMVLRAFKDRAKRFGVSVGETTHHDDISSAGITIAIVTTDRASADAILSKLETEWYNAGGGDIIDEVVYEWHEGVEGL